MLCKFVKVIESFNFLVYLLLAMYNTYIDVTITILDFIQMVMMCTTMYLEHVDVLVDLIF